jgi:primosomal protein N' (replication factor Y)
MSLYAQVLPNPGRPLGQLFTYRVPEHLQDAVRVGSQVLVPFGSRTVVGLVGALSEKTDRQDLRDIESVLADVPVLSAESLALAEWIADYYICELGEALRPFLPEGMTYRISRKFRLTGDPIALEVLEHPDAGPVVEHLQSAEREVSIGALRRLLAANRLQRALRLLKSRRLVEERSMILPPRARERQVRMIEVAVPVEEAARYCKARADRAPARVAALRVALGSGCLPAGELARRASVSAAAIRGLVEDGMVRPHWIPVRRRPWTEAADESKGPAALTPEQAAAVAAVNSAVDSGEHSSFLLYGVTASGKTEVYLRVIERVLAAGRQAIVLVPEISLTAQAISIYRGRFGDQVALVHSALSLGERWDEWQRIRSGEAGVVLGARSAVFAATPKLGLIVVDEEHETSYKQEQAPRYHAREVALKRGELARCPVLLASATPALETFHDAERGRHTLLRLPERVDSRPLPAVRVVDMRGSEGRQAILSSAVRQALAARLREGEQVILFLNRRGFATFLLCPVCGQAVRCDECGVALKYHREAREVRCHHCGVSRSAPDICAKCGSHQIRFSGFGTERVERELRRIMPAARIGRMDRDTTARKGAHLRIVGQFRSAETNVLIGTQMVAKGFDFPGVTLVGVISADTSLNLPDFRAAERTFQLLEQVSGRAGRGEKEGEVIIQTYRPDDDSIGAAAAHDYESFYRGELENRRELNYPPLSQLVNVIVTSEQEDTAAQRAGALADALRAAGGDRVQILGPAAAPLARLRGRYRWHVIVKGPRGHVQAVVREALGGVGALAAATLSVDVDPVSLM